MDEPQRASLLTPSLADGGVNEMPYSAGSFFWVSFFGGVFAAAWWFFINARRLGRVSHDALATAGAVAVGVVAVYVAATWLLPQVEAETATRDLMRNVRLALRVVGLMVWFALSLRHRPLIRAAEMSGRDYPSPWLPGIGVIIGASVINFGLVTVVRVVVGV